MLSRKKSLFFLLLLMTCWLIHIIFRSWKSKRNVMLSRKKSLFFLLLLVTCWLIHIIFHSSVDEIWKQRQNTLLDSHKVTQHRQGSYPRTTIVNGPANKTIKVDVPCTNNANLSHQSQLVTVHRAGQLGNNMFEYAGLLGVARRNNRTPFISPNSVLANVFQITHKLSVPNTNKWKLIGEPRYGTYDPRFECLPRGPLLLQCYFQSYKYFQDLDSTIRKEFTFKPDIDRSALNLLKQILAGRRNVTKVGVHVRRGDKLTQKEIRSGERVAPVSYFRNAFKWMRAKYTNALFIVTSDAKSWVTANLQATDVINVPAASGPVHLSLLTHCDHVIMSLGTFGWWAGWLAGGDVIYFNQPLIPNSWKGQRLKMDDFFPNHWIGLGV